MCHRTRIAVKRPRSRTEWRNRMPKNVGLIVPCFMFLALTGGLCAQDKGSADVEKHIDAARKIAGKEWAQEANFFCSTEKQVAAMHILPSATQNDPPELQRAEPTKVFDNLYFVGTKEVTTWVITTPDGYIMIDSGYAGCLLYTSPSPRDRQKSRMPSS